MTTTESELKNARARCRWQETRIAAAISILRGYEMEPEFEEALRKVGARWAAADADEETETRHC